MKTIAMLLAALAFTGATTTPATADPQIAKPGGVYVAKVDPAPKGPKISVTLSNGKSATLKPCIYEDGRRCYWQSDARGNGKGDSFIVMSGRVFYVDLSGFPSLAKEA